MAQWVFYAILAMVFIAVSNIFFKIWVKENFFGAKDFFPLIALVLLGFLAALGYAVFLLKAQEAWAGLLAALLISNAAGFVMVYLALRDGKVALVSAVVGMSTVLVAVLSFVFLGDRFSVKELAAVGLALLSILFFVA